MIQYYYSYNNNPRQHFAENDDMNDIIKRFIHEIQSLLGLEYVCLFNMDKRFLGTITNIGLVPSSYLDTFKWEK